MGNFISVVISWVVYTITLIILLMTGLTMYQAQAIPNYRELTNRMIMTTGKLDDDTIKYIEKQSKNRVVITRVNKDGQDYGTNTDTSIEPYGTRIDYMMDVNAFGYGGVAKVKKYSAGHFYSITQINCLTNADVSMLHTQATFATYTPDMNATSTIYQISPIVNAYFSTNGSVDLNNLDYMSLVNPNGFKVFSSVNKADRRSIVGIAVNSVDLTNIETSNASFNECNGKYTLNEFKTMIQNVNDIFASGSDSIRTYKGVVSYELSLSDGTKVNETQSFILPSKVKNSK